jgi:hypothetical protein
VSDEAPSPAVVVEVLGVPVGITAPGSEAVRLRRQWSRALTDRDAVTTVDSGRPSADDEVASDYALTSRVTLAALDATAGTRLNLHAGAVADDRGRVLTLIGPSGSGKTTAIALLATRLGYLSDETTSLDADLVVHPHAKPLSVITDPATPHLKQSVSPDDLALVRPPAACHLHRIVLLHRGDDDRGLQPVAHALAIAEIVAQTSSLVRLEHPILRLADTIDACGGAWGLHYREFGDWIDELVTLLDREPQPPPPRVHHPGGGALAEPAPGAWRRTPWLDAVEYDDEVVLMVDDQVRVLAGPGVVAWLALETPSTTREVVAAITEVLGEHPDADHLVEDALRAMADQGLVVGPDQPA